MPSAKVGNLHSPVTKVECRRDRYLHVRPSQPSRVDAKPPRVGCGFGGGESDLHRLMGDPCHVGKSSQSERVVVVPMCHHDCRQWQVCHAGKRRANRTALLRTRPGVDQQRALRSDDESKIHRFGLGHSHVHARSHLMPGPERWCGGRFDSRWRLGHHARLALCLCECQPVRRMSAPGMDV
jgi:hypothetical protein